MKKYKIAILAVLGCIGLMGFSTAVNIGIKEMFDNSGKVKQIKLSTGQTYSASTLATVFSGGSGNASYPIDLSGTQTTGINPVAKGGTGTNTATLDGFAHTGTSTFPSGVWGNTGNVGIGTTTPTTELHVIGTVTASVGFSGNGSALTGIVKQVAGTSTGMTATNITIAGTNSTGTFKNVTVTGTLESGSQWDTAGSWTSTVGIGQSARIVSVGSSTNSISLECSGPIYANNGTVSVNLTHMPQIWAKGSTTADVISTITGTSSGTFTTFTIPANSMGNVGYFKIYPQLSTPASPGYTISPKILIYDGVATTTAWNPSGLNTVSGVFCLRNTGSTSVNSAQPLTRVNGLGDNTNIACPDYTIRTYATMTVSLTANTTVSTGTVQFIHCFLEATYID